MYDHWRVRRSRDGGQLRDFVVHLAVEDNDHAFPAV
jgi:hypothetical protein